MKNSDLVYILYLYKQILNGQRNKLPNEELLKQTTYTVINISFHWEKYLLFFEG